MSPRQSNPPPKRPRGRPKGTAPFAHQDRRVLAAFADGAIGVSRTELAPFLTERGYQDKDIRRAQKRWREEGAELLREAQMRADASRPESLVDLIACFAEWMSPVAETAQPAIGALARSLERARRRVAAREELGQDPMLPLDLTDPAEVDQAICRFEETVGAGRLPPGSEGVTVDKLPLSLRLYGAALLVHQLSLQAAERESQEAMASGDKAAKSRECGS